LDGGLHVGQAQHRAALHPFVVALPGVIQPILLDLLLLPSLLLVFLLLLRLLLFVRLTVII
jgi:hypothetical protein